MSNVKKACVAHVNDMCELMVKTKDLGYIFQPDNPGSWDGTKDFLLKSQAKATQIGQETKLVRVSIVVARF